MTEQEITAYGFKCQDLGRKQGATEARLSAGKALGEILDNGKWYCPWATIAKLRRLARDLLTVYAT